MQFNLTDQPWIPVIDEQGRTIEVSLTDALTGAHLYQDLAGETPTQSLALLRLLLAVTHAAVGPADPQGWVRLWSQRRLPADAIATYLLERRNRFDLLHAEAPFYQVADLSTVAGPRQIASLVPARRHYTTREGAGRERASFADAARWLVHCHAYDATGIKGAAAGDPRASGGRVFPIGPGSLGLIAAITLEGTTLAETILLNLVPASERPVAEDDAPTWDRPPATAAPRDSETPDGVLDLYTWQSRRVRLHWDAHGATGVLVCQGDRLNLDPETLVEPMVLWRRDTTGVWRRRRYDPDRPAWQSFAASLSAETGVRTPLVRQWAATALHLGLLDAEYRITFRVTGVQYGAKGVVIDDAGTDAVTVPAVALGATGGLPELVKAAVKAASSAERLVAEYARDLAAAAGAYEPNGGLAPAALAARAELDVAMRAWMRGLTGDTADLGPWLARARAIVDRIVDAEPVPAAAWRARRINGRLVTAGTAIARFQRARDTFLAEIAA
jgi:CRISPR system Cascade subunit CasA